MSYKRILNELNRVEEKLRELELDDKFRFAQLDIDIIPNKIGIVNKKTDRLELKIETHSSYPFRPPIVYLETNPDTRHNTNYSRWLADIIKIQSNKSNKSNDQGNNKCDYFLAWLFSVIHRPNLSYIWYNKIPNKNSCMCCDSIVCSDKWAPIIKLYDILVEYITRKDFKTNCTPLMQRYIEPIFNNDRWVLPEDIIMLILDFIIPPIQIKN